MTSPDALPTPATPETPEQAEIRRGKTFRAAVIEMLGMEVGDELPRGGVQVAKYRFGPDDVNEIIITLIMHHETTPPVVQGGELEYPHAEMQALDPADPKIRTSITIETANQSAKGQVKTSTDFRFNADGSKLERHFDVASATEGVEFVKEWQGLSSEERERKIRSVVAQGLAAEDEKKAAGMHDVDDEGLNAFLAAAREAIKTGKQIWPRPTK